ncbi:hypothetical protein BN59_03306 [Legionella massiliensis]|uniref:Uncharacterized protein n=1 Tax=Legionella massiliensis TaxID=1034943 RepID=A0A078L1C9_9GAMM|nr:hypothetical protein [Legionella massiliensis]CDZ78991.1 hypothetical protein BN59_03306 [Legionella massiliensis]CEE14729.1 hypothetical protein BN1094_03306 [Legionella massiliensis]
MGKTKEKLQKSMDSYGKISATEQYLVLLNIVDQAKRQTDFSKETAAKLNNFSAEIRSIETQNQEEKLKRAMIAFNRLIAEIENNDKHQKLLQFLKDKGLYRILYHNAKMKGIEDDSGLKTVMKAGFIGIGLSALAVIFFALVTMLAAPFWLVVIASGLFAAAATFVAAILYGVVNDLFATHSNLAYFLLGHQPQQNSLLQTNDPVAQGVAWGVAATFGPALIAAIVFGIAATITAGFVPLATFVFPVMLIAMPLIAVGAEIYARKKAREYADSERGLWVGSNFYQQQGLEVMSPTREERAAWYANSDRNLFGFTKVPLIGVAALATVCTLSGVSMFLPAVLFSTVVMSVVPVAAVGVAIVALLALGIYTYVNRNKQIDNRSKLDFSSDNVSEHAWELYLEEDMHLVQELQATTESSLVSEKEDDSHFDFGLLSRRTSDVELSDSDSDYDPDMQENFEREKVKEEGCVF